MGFEEFLDARLAGLLRYATVLTQDPYLAEDVVQDVLVKAQVRWGRIEQAGAPEQYVRRMVLNEFLSWRRRRSTRTVPLDTPALDAVAPVRPDGTARVDERDRVLRVLGTLPRRQRAVLVLRYFEDLPDPAIAELLGCRPATVRSLAARALATLRGVVPELTTTTGGAG